jgi:multidrug efflux pump
MNITDLFLKRPVFAICLNLLLLLAGIAAFYNLNVRQYPRSDNASIVVRTAYVGADADLVRGFISTPLERVIASSDGIDYIESQSVQGLSTITARLRLNFDLNTALTQVQSKVSQVRNDLPPESEVPVIAVENADSRIAAMYLSFYSSEMPQNKVTDYIMRVVQPRLSALEGVEKADILGARTFAMRIWLKPDAMAAFGLTSAEVRLAIAANNVLSAVGQTRGELITVNLAANSDLKSVKEFEQLVVKSKDGRLVRVKDIAEVSLGAEQYTEEVYFSGEQAVFMGVWVLPNTNVIEVIDRVREELKTVETLLPKNLKLGIPYDSTAYVKDALKEVTKTLTETIFIVVIVIFLFIGSFRAVLVPLIAVPLSLVGALALVYAAGFTLNLLTLLAIVLAVGLVVDDAIVVLENVERHVSEGKTPFEAAKYAARELWGPIVAMTITLAAVYAPIGLQGGLTGALFREFAFTLAGAVLVSGFVAITISPLMSAYLVRADGHSNLLIRTIESTFNGLKASFEVALKYALSIRYAVLLGTILMALLCVPFYSMSIKELAPREDQGVVFGILQASASASLDETNRFAKLTQEVFQSLPEYHRSFQIVNANGGFSGALLRPWSERARDAETISQQLWGQMSVIPGIRMIMTTPPPLPGGSDFPIEFVISSTAEPRILQEYADGLVFEAFKSGLFMYADSDLKFDLPQSEFTINRDMLRLSGVSLADIGADLGSLFGGNYVNRFNIDGRAYKVVAQADRMARLNPEQILNSHIAVDGKMVPLRTFASFTRTAEPRSLNRFQQLNSAKIQGAIPPGVSIDAALKVLEGAASRTLPRDIVVDYAGESRQLRREGETLLISLFVALLIVYLVLASQFESFRAPLVVLLGSVPVALAGALIFPFFGATTLNIYSQVGLITLVGLVAKNGILIVEFGRHLQEKGFSREAAVAQAAATRLRPILMTSIATVVGHFPLVIAAGPGAGARNSIGIVLVTGMLIGTALTLFVVPAIYTFLMPETENAA